MFISVSVMPYRSTTRAPVAAAIRSWSCTGSAADPDTSSRAPDSARTSSGSAGSASAIRWYIVGTPNSMVAPSFSSWATPSVVNRPRWRTRAAAAQRAEGAEDQAVHVEQGQAVHQHVVGRPPPRVGEGVQRRGDRTAGITAPLGGPVVPEV